MTSMLCAIAMMACGSPKQSVTLDDLAGEWKIEQVAGIPVNAENEAFLGFDVQENRLYGNAGCNSVMGGLQSKEPGKLAFESVASTKRMCADMATEDAILQAMGNVKAFDLQGEALMLTDAEGNVLMQLKKK